MSRNSRVTGTNPHPNPPSRNLNKEVEQVMAKARKQMRGAGVPRKGTPMTKLPTMKVNPVEVMRKGLGYMRNQ